MKTTTKRESLLEALEAVSPAIATSTTIPEEQAVMLDADGNTLLVRAQSVTIGASVSITGNSSENGAAVVPHAKLLALLQGGPEDVSLSLSDGRLNIAMGRTKAGIAAYNPSGFMQAHQVKCKAIVTMPGKELADILHTTAAAAGDRSYQEWHKAVCFRSNKDGIVVYGADGKQFSAIKLNHPTTDSFDSSISNKEIRKIIPAIAGCSEAALMFGDSGLSLSCDDVSFTIQAMSILYPDVNKVCEQFAGGKLTMVRVSREQLLSAIRQANVLQSAIEFNVKLSSNGDGLRITASSSDNGGYDNTIEAANGEGFTEVAEVGVNHKMLLSHLQSIKSNAVDIAFSNDMPIIRLSPPERPGHNYYTSLIKKIEAGK